MTRKVTFELSDGKTVEASVGYIDESGGVRGEMIKLFHRYSHLSDRRLHPRHNYSGS